MEIYDYIQTLDGFQLEELRRYIEKQEQVVYDRRENFHLHERVDQFIYVIEYADGHLFYDCIGKRAYEKYLKDEDAIRIGRKTKSLFPTYDKLMEKELRH